MGGLCVGGDGRRVFRGGKGRVLLRGSRGWCGRLGQLRGWRGSLRGGRAVARERWECGTRV